MSSLSAPGVRPWLVSRLASACGLDARSIDVRERFSRYGLDSLKATALIVALSEHLGRPLSPTLVWEHPTIEALAAYLSGETVASSAQVAAAGEPARAWDASEPIAIVGMACRFPQAADLDAYWCLLVEGVDAITEVPAGRWDVASLHDPDLAAPGKVATKWGGFLDQVDRFDPAFFGISPREAIQIDPQQRLSLELSWEALEDAGIPPRGLHGSRTAVFMGAMWTDYAKIPGGDLDFITQHTATGQDLSIVPARISYTLGLRGPCLAVNTACSSALVAVHLARQSLLSGECDLALAGGVNLMLAPDSTVAMSKFGAMAPDGRSKAFDARANGYVRGEGGGLVVLMRLSAALAAGHRIHAVLRGSAVNNDGPSNGLTAPSPMAQELVVRDACLSAGVEPRQVQYVEAHGTGTMLGDPIEAGALGAVLGAGRPADRPLVIGSVKTNIGHLEAAAGIAGLIKVVLAMRHRVIPPSLHFQKPNPHIAFEALRLRVQAAPGPWPEAEDGRALAGVSSFGFGGTNCHVVVEAAPDGEVCVLPLSAPSLELLRSRALGLRMGVTGAERPALAELCAATAAHLSGDTFRLALTARSHEDVASGLDAWLAGTARPGLSSGVVRGAWPVFVFAGQGSQWLGMGRTLLRDEPAFRAALQRVDRAARPHLGRSLLALLASADGAWLEDTALVQPAIFALQVALSALFRAWGIEPAAVVGQSMGEVAAAHVAGCLELADAARIICARSRIVQRARGQGGMAVVELPLDEAWRAIEGRDGLAVAVSTSPSSTVVSGDVGALDELLGELSKQDVFCRRIKVDYASHGPHMEPLREEMLAAFEGIRPRPGTVPFVSAVTGAILPGEALDAEYWWRNLREPVLFTAAMATLIEQRHDVFVEVDPHPLLARAIEQCVVHGGREATVLSAMRRDEDERVVARDALGALYTRGARVAWERVQGRVARPVSRLAELGLALPGAVAGDLGSSSTRDAAPPADESEPALLVLSAHSEEALARRARDTAAFLGERPDVPLADVAFTAALLRSPLPHRLAVVVPRERGREAVRELLAAAARGETPAGTVRGRAEGQGAPRLVFVFPGQGSQWLGMGRVLFAAEPTFRAALQGCDAAIAREAGFSVIEELHAGEAASQLGRIDVVQPVLFAVEVALAALWRSWGVEPAAVVGHSMGEIAAAHVAGILSLEDAAGVICRRSRLLREVSGQGAMALVELSAPETSAALIGLEDRLSVAVSNAPRATVISGDPAALGEVLARLEAQGVFCRRIKVDVASHSPQMDPLLDELRSLLREVRPETGRIAMWSTVTVQRVNGPHLDAGYWADNLRAPVLFSGAIQALASEGHTLFVEVSPHPVLLPSVEESLREARQEGAAVASVRRDLDERRCLLESLGALWAHGCEIDWRALLPAGGRAVALPTYPWQRGRCWLDVPAHGATRARGRAPARGQALLGVGYTLSTQTTTRVWETTLDLSRLPWLRDHRVQGVVVLPGAGYLEMALSAGAEVAGGSSPVVTEVTLVEALALPGDAPVAVQMVTTEEHPGRLRFQIASRGPGAESPSWTVHARGVLRASEPSEVPARLDLASTRSRLGEAAPAGGIYPALAELGLEYGPAFQGLTELRRGENEALGRVRLPEAAGGTSDYRVHPALLDACFQVMVGSLGDREKSTWVPVEVGVLRLFKSPVGELFCHATPASSGAEGREDRRSADLLVVDPTGAPVARVSGLVLQRLVAAAPRREEDDWFLGLTWEVVPAPDPGLKIGRFLLLGDGDGLGVKLHAALASRGHTVVHAAPGEPGEAPSGGVPASDTSVAGVHALLRDVFQGQAPSAVVHLGSLAGAEDLDAEGLLAAQVCGYDSVLSTVQALAGKQYRDAPRLWLVTRGAQAAGNARIAVEQAPVLGLGRTIAMEHPEMRCGRIDLDPCCPEEETESLLAELLGNSPEQEIALRGGERRVARLARALREAAPRDRIEPAGGRPFHLTIDKPGVLDDLVLRSMKRHPPGPGEVEIAVEAAGLNFMDVMKAMGIYPGLGDGSPALGSEVAGRVAAVGEGVSGLNVGEVVMATAPSGFTTHVHVDARMVARLPAGMSATQASTVLVVFITAWYGLVHLARIQAGERVLIHSATGGTGLAAVQIARHFGAEVFATAGSAGKRAWLREHGIVHVLDSRSLSLAEEVMKATGGEGVDVVLSSLSGAAIEASLSALAADGRFIELGKTDIHADRPLGLAHFKKSLSYSAVDLAGLRARRPERFSALLHEVVSLFARGTLHPLPVETFPVSRAAEAFRKMAQGRHIGKLALTFEDPDVAIHVPDQPRAAIRRGGTYLVTGGLGGLGLSVAGWLADKGAGHLVLVGRSGAASPEQKAAVAALEARGARVTVTGADVAVREQMVSVLAEIAACGMPLCGIIHAAGLLDDGLLAGQTPARFRAVMAPKILGAFHLHELTAGLPLDFFVLYSSVSGLLGSPGQGNYAAANTFLDALAHHRKARGLPALSLDWGPFSEVGLAAAQGNRAARLASRGLRSLTPEEGLAALERCLGVSSAQAVIAPIDVRQWVESHPAAASSSLLAGLRATRPEAPRAASPGGLAERITRAEPSARAALVQGFLRSEAARVLRVPEEKLDPRAPLTGLGMDSLMGMELRNRMEAALGVRMPATLLWTYPTISALGKHLLEQIAAPAEVSVPLREGAPAEASAPDGEARQSEDPQGEEDLFALVQQSLTRAAREDITV